VSVYHVRTGPHRLATLVPSLAECTDVWGVYVGAGCVSGEYPLEWRHADGHAHVARSDEWRGWICIPDTGQVLTPKKNPTHLLLHEVAHVIVGSDRHDQAWKDVVSDLGASREAAMYVRGRRIN